MLARCITKVLLSLLILVPVSARAVYFEPAPGDYLEGRALSVTELNLYVEAPSSEWDWLIASATQGEGNNRLHFFACDLYGLRQISLVVSDPYWYPTTAANASRFVDGMIEEFEAEGYVATVVEPVLSDIPLPGAYRFQIVGENHLGARRYIYGYYATQGRTFGFMHWSVEDSEPEEFTSLVRSFRFIGEPPRGPLDSAPAAHRVLAFAIVLLVGSVGWVINKVSGRVVFNQWIVSLVLLFVAGFGLTIFWFPKIQGPEALGRFLAGSITFPFFLPVLFAVWRSKALEKRKAGELEESRTAGDKLQG